MLPFSQRLTVRRSLTPRARAKVSWLEKPALRRAVAIIWPTVAASSEVSLPVTGQSFPQIAGNGKGRLY